MNHRLSTIVYHIPGDLINDVSKFNSVMDDIALTWLFGMKIVICVGCRRQMIERLERLHGNSDGSYNDDCASLLGMRITTPETLLILEEEAGFCRFEVERQLNRCLRNKGADCNVVSGCFITAKPFGVVDGVDYQVSFLDWVNVMGFISFSVNLALTFVITVSFPRSLLNKHKPSLITFNPKLTGYPTHMQTDKIHRLHSKSDVVLLTPLGFTQNGDALNIHSEALAAFTAGALEASKIVYFSSYPMVLRDTNQRIQMIQRSSASQILSHYGLTIHNTTGFPRWKTSSLLNKDQRAMLLKMGWATYALEKGVERAHIVTCEDGALLEELFTARRGFGKSFLFCLVHFCFNCMLTLLYVIFFN